MSTCKHKWDREPYAGSVKCIKCGHVEFDVAGECLSLQERAEKAEARVAELEASHKKLLDGISEDCAKMRSILGND